jgi:hypothetical protein
VAPTREGGEKRPQGLAMGGTQAMKQQKHSEYYLREDETMLDPEWEDEAFAAYQKVQRQWKKSRWFNDQQNDRRFKDKEDRDDDRAYGKKKARKAGRRSRRTRTHFRYGGDDPLQMF